MDWETEGLLAGVEGAAREGRRALLDELYADGVDVETLRQAAAADRLALLPIERALLPPARWTLAEVAERAGVPEAVVELRMRALGVLVPEDPAVAAFGEADVEMARRAASYLDAGLPLDEARGVMRVMGGSVARCADAMRRLFAQAYLRPGDSEREVARRYAERARELLPLVAADLEYLLRQHLRDHARHDALSLTDRTAGRVPDAVEVSVAFADIVGFTRLGQEVPEVELTDIAERLDDLAAEHVRRPARVVKTIGDAVMVVSPEPAALVDAMLDLLDAAEAADGFPPLRAGIAQGLAVPRLGDWFGPTVNLASRLCGRARPESVLVTHAVRESLGDAPDRYRFSEAGLKRLKGIGEPVPVLRVRRAGGG